MSFQKPRVTFGFDTSMANVLEEGLLQGYKDIRMAGSAPAVSQPQYYSFSRYNVWMEWE